MSKYKVKLAIGYTDLTFTFDDFIKATSFVEMALDANPNVVAKIYIVKENQEESEDDE